MIREHKKILGALGALALMTLGIALMSAEAASTALTAWAKLGGAAAVCGAVRTLERTM